MRFPLSPACGVALLLTWPGCHLLVGYSPASGDGSLNAEQDVSSSDVSPGDGSAGDGSPATDAPGDARLDGRPRDAVSPVDGAAADSSLDGPIVADSNVDVSAICGLYPGCTNACSIGNYCWHDVNGAPTCTALPAACGGGPATCSCLVRAGVVCQGTCIECNARIICFHL